MSTKTLTAVQSAVIDAYTQYYNDHTSATATLSNNKMLVVGFDESAVTGSDRWREITASSFAVYLYGGYSGALRAYELYEGFDAETVTYSNLGDYNLTSFGDLVPDASPDYDAYQSTGIGSDLHQSVPVCKFGALLAPYYASSILLDTAQGTNKPKVTLTLGNVCGLDTISLHTLKQMYWGGPWQYYIGLPTRIYWSAYCTKATIQTPAQVSAVLTWREAEGQTEHTISVSGTSSYVTIPANTFTTASVQVKVAVTTDSNITTTSDWVTMYSAGVGFSIDPSPASGYVSKHVDNTFRWAHVLDEGVTGDVEQTAAIFHWRPVGGADTPSAQLGTDDYYIIPANTFVDDDIEWMVETVANGIWQQTSWMQMSTVEALPTAIPVAPINTVVDGSAEITFRWNHQISTGTAQTAAYLQISADGGATWSQLASVASSNNYYIAPAGSITAGDKLWRVATYNTDGNHGPYCDPVQFVVVSASPAPSVTATAVPLPLISWQATGQQGYEVYIDGAIVASGWGTATSYQATDILADGTHTIQVRVCNQYGLWSEYGSAGIIVANAPGNAVNLTVMGGESATLSWTTSGYDSFLVMRDGEVIGETEDYDYTDDEASAGSHIYQVIGLLSSGYYGPSAEVNTTITILCPMVKIMSTGAWIKFPKFLHGQNSVSDGWSPDANIVHYSGRGYPDAEFGAMMSRTVTIRPAFTADDSATIALIPTLIGRVLYYKDPRGAAFTATITQLTSEAHHYCTTYNITLTRIDGGASYA